MATLNSIATRTTPGYVRSALPKGYLDGIRMVWSSSTNFILGAGFCRDSTDTRDIVTSIVNFADVTSGTGALTIDTGSIAAAKVYYVYAIASADGATVSATFSLNASTPALPTGYTLYRRVGSFLTDAGAATIQWFAQRGYGRTRTTTARAVRQLFTDSTPDTVTPVAIDCSAMCPSGGAIILDVVNDPGSNTATYEITFGPDATSATVYRVFNGYRSEQNGSFTIPINAADDIYYVSSSETPTLTVNTPGYVEYL
jgi:hypothetical protein